MRKVKNVLKVAFLPLLLIVGLAISAMSSQRETPNLNKHSAIVRLYDIATGRFFCSGAVISDHLIVSAAHCMYGHSEGIEVRNKDGKFTGAWVMDYRFKDISDQAVLIGNFTMFEHLPIVTDPAHILYAFRHANLKVCGFPYAGPLFCSEVHFKQIYVFQIMTDGGAWPGMSGGPVFDEDTGYIIGVTTAMSPEGMILSPTVNLFYNLGLDEVK